MEVLGQFQVMFFFCRDFRYGFINELLIKKHLLITRDIVELQ